MSPQLPTMTTVVAPRDNQQWVDALAGNGAEKARAQHDLREILVKGLRRVLAARGASTDLCEDLAQESLLRIGERLSTFRGEARFVTWALAIATRLAFDELRHRRWKDVSFEQASADARAPIAFEPMGDSGQEKNIVRHRVLVELRDALDNHLTDRQRAVLIAELNGLPQAEIAASLGLNRNALYKLSHDARKRVKHHLETADISAADVLWVFE